MSSQAKTGSRAGNALYITFGAIMCGLLFIFGIFLAHGSAFLGLVVMVVAFALFLSFLKVYDQKRSAIDFPALCQKEGLNYKSNLSDPKKNLLLGISDDNTRVLVQFGCSGNVHRPLIDLTQVLNVELAVNDHSVYQAGPMASLSAAAVGGLAFGGAGAVIGSLAAGQLGRGMVGSASLKLRLNDIDEPLIEIQFICEPLKASSDEAKARLALAEKWTNLVEVMRHRLAQGEAA